MNESNALPASVIEKKSIIEKGAADGDPLFIETSGTSMEPLLSVGDLVGFLPASGHKLHVGDLFLYDDNGDTVCHRFLGTYLPATGNGLWQKGDNISEPSAINPDYVLARVVYLEIKEGRVLLNDPFPRFAKRLLGAYLRALEILWHKLHLTGSPPALKRHLQRLVVVPLDYMTRWSAKR